MASDSNELPSFTPFSHEIFQSVDRRNPDANSIGSSCPTPLFTMAHTMAAAAAAEVDAKIQIGAGARSNSNENIMPLLGYFTHCRGGIKGDNSL